MAFIVVSAFLVVVAAAIVAVLCFWCWPGKPEPFLDERGRPIPHSISEKVRLDINGFEQGMFLRARDDRRPVLLYLHGGMPEHFLARRARLHLRLRRGVGLLRQPDGAAQGVLHLQPVLAQPDVRRARQAHDNPAGRCAQWHQPAG